MENNKQIQDEEIKKGKDESLKVLKYITIAILIFSGAFCATYVVTDLHYRQFEQPDYIFNSARLNNQIDKDIQDMQQEFERNTKIMDDQFEAAKFEQNDNFYRIVVNLKNFDNDENNITYSVKNNTLIISGEYVKKQKGLNQTSKFSQSYTLDKKAQLNKLTKGHKNNYLIITIPIKK